MNNTKNLGYAVIVVAACAVAGLGPACAQEGGKVMIDVADCIKLAASESRLACYESRVAAVFGERAAQAAAVRPAAPVVAAAAPTRVPEPAPAANPTPPVAPATPPTGSRTVAAAPPSAPAATEPVQSRGDRQSRREESDRAEAADAAANDIVSRVKDLREVLPNAWQITLENGQVWRQSVSKHFELRPGAPVKIYTTHWGSAHRLSTDNLNGYIQVERVH